MQEERLRRIEARKQRKKERELALYGGAALEGPQGGEDLGNDHEENELDLNASVSGMKMYDNNETTITVTTTALSRDIDDLRSTHPVPNLSCRDEKGNSLLAKKKPLKRVQHKSRKKIRKPSPQKKDRRKSKSMNR